MKFGCHFDFRECMKQKPWKKSELTLRTCKNEFGKHESAGHGMKKSDKSENR